ncbi:ornithine cyclodeaminase [Hypericibacter terrae]|uniref:Ornithine cyclodeaminase n=1 Tax=Hypericibacter terrae TaxID=2602015 RepID=A0A5J6MH74_9PROT|nr:ornithine cyclodeaminase family protein [Hypericibacter terrae]QEX16799.1 ornithine cyclodeaminase [Hypericibacter terrae]
MPSPIHFTYLNGPDMAALALTDDEILGAIEASLAMQGRGQTVIEPRMHLRPRDTRGHFNVLRGVLPTGEGRGFAGVKIVGDFIDNWQRDLPSEMAMLLLFDPATGMPQALIDATAITEMRTGAVTAIGAKYLARKDSHVLGHVGARGTAYWNVRLLNRLFDLTEIRVHSKRKESREAFAATLERDLKRKIVVTEDWESCFAGADILVEASRLDKPEPLFKTEWVRPGALAIPYGTMSAVEIDLTDAMDKVVMDDWGQAGAGPFGALRRHVDEGRLTRETLHAELGQIVAGLKPGRETPTERILFWHRGLSLSDIALGALALEKARRLGIGSQLRYA